MDWDWVNGREGKPRQTGFTMVIDTGMGIGAFKDLLHVAGAYIDFIKLGFGTTAITPANVLQDKIECAKQHDVWIYPGGTFFEAAFARGNWQQYFTKLEQVGFPAVEISEGTLSLPPGMREIIINKASESFLVLSEVGKKAKGSQVTLQELRYTYERDLAAGASYVIVEGRESGKDVGIYNRKGDLDPDFVREAETVTGPDIIWEAPLKSQQVALINLLGPHIHLGNVAPSEALAVETLRRGLRSDTFALNFQEESMMK